MPIYEYSCPDLACAAHGQLIERFLQHSDPEPVCSCGRPLARHISRFAIAFSGEITSRYNDKSKESPGMEGHWVTERNTPDGKPKQRYLSTWQERREWMKQEGLRDDIGCIEGRADGKNSGTMGCGLPGAWV